MSESGRAELPLMCRGVWKVFGTRTDEALELAGRGSARQEILDETGCVVAVRDVSFSVRRGETFVVMGLSGSGKSTLIRCLSRLVEPTAGEVLIDGDDVCGFDDDRLRDLRRHKVSMVFQHFGLFPHRRVIDNVAFGLEVQGVPRADRHERATEVLRLVGLDGWESHYPQQLSGGMQQRVGLARALTVDPEILFFDEPFSALDPLIRRDMQDELIALQDRLHRTLVFITHDFDEALKLGDRIAVMKDGAFVQVGTPQQVVASPADDYVREFTRDVPKAKVLTVGSVMSPPGTGGPVGPPVLAADRLETVLPRLIASPEPVPVVDAEGQVVGSLVPEVVAAAVDPEAP